jgi:hypothetical protein
MRMPSGRAARVGKVTLLIGAIAGVLYWLSRSPPRHCAVELRIYFSAPLPHGAYDVEISGHGYRTKCQFERPGEGRKLTVPGCSGDQLFSQYEIMSFLGVPARPPVVKVRLVRDGVRVIEHSSVPQYREGQCPSAEIWLPSFRVAPE